MVEHAYRAYEIGEDGHVRGRTDLLQCRNDQAAKEHAMRLVDGHAIELWDGPCRLAKFEPLDWPTAQSPTSRNRLAVLPKGLR
jgi:hypothetical protein